MAVNKDFGFIRCAILLCSVLLGAGLAGPSMSVTPHFGKFSAVVAAFKPGITAPERFSLLGAVSELLRGPEAGECFVGLILFVFSVFFPVLKLGVMWASAASVRRGEEPMRLLSFIDRHGKLSMLDIYVMALVVLAIKGLPGGTTVSLHWAAAAFACSILLSLKIPSWIIAAGSSPHRLPQAPGQSSFAEAQGPERDC